MALLVTTPPSITFSKETALWQWEDDRAGLISGIKAENLIAIDNNVVEGAQMVIRWGENDLRVIATAFPDTTGIYIPLYTYNAGTHEAYVKSLVPILSKSYFLSEDFEVSAVSYVILGVTIWTVKLTAKRTGAKYNCSKTTFQGGGVSNLVAGVDDSSVINNSVFVEVWLGDADSVNYERIYKAPIELDAESKAKLNVSEVLHGYLTPEIPDFILPVAQKCRNSRRKYYLKYAQAGGENINIGELTETAKFVTILGGGSELNGAPRTVEATFKNPVTSEDKLLMLQGRTRYVRQDEPIFVSWINFRTANKNIHARATVTFQDGTTVFTNTGVVFGVETYEKLVFGVGFKQLNFGAYNGVKVVKEYSVQLRDDTGFVSEPLRCIVNYAHEEYPRYFAHINSLGAVETITTFGKGGSEWKVFKETAEKLLPYDFNSKSAQYVDWNLNYQDTTEVATGFMPKKRLRWFLDFFMSALKFRIVNGLAFAIGVNSDTIQRGADGDNQFGFLFEFQYQRKFDAVAADDIEGQDDADYVPANVIVAGEIVTGGNTAGGGTGYVDPYPIAGSANPVASSGVLAALLEYQKKLSEGNIYQYRRGDNTLGNFNSAVNAAETDPSVPSYAKTLTSKDKIVTDIGLPQYILSPNGAGTIATDQLLNFNIPSGFYGVRDALKTNGWPFDGDGTIQREIHGESGARIGADTATDSTGKQYIRAVSESGTSTEWKKVATGEEPTFENIPTLYFPIGQVTIQTIDLADYLVSANDNLKMDVLEKPEFVQSLTVNGLKATITGFPSTATDKGVILEVTDLDTGDSRTVKVPVVPREPVTVKFNLYDAKTSSVIAEIPQNGTGSFVNREKLDIQFVVTDEPHNGVYAAIVGGGDDGAAVNEKWTDKDFETLPEIISNGTYRMWSFIGGRSLPKGVYNVFFKVGLNGSEIYAKTVTFEITELELGQADFEMWDETTGSGFKVADIEEDGSSVFRSGGKYDIHFAVKDVLHNQVYAKITDLDDVILFQWGSPHENVTETENHVYQLFGPGSTGYADAIAGGYHVYLEAFMDDVLVYDKDSIFNIADEGEEPTIGSGRFELWDETTTAVKVGDILLNNSSSYPVTTKADVRINIFNIKHNQVYAEIRNSFGEAIFTFNKPYETVATATDAVYQMFGPSGSWMNITAKGYQIYFKAQMDGIVVFEKSAAFILTSSGTPNNGIAPVELRNITTGAKVADVPLTGGSYPLPSVWDFALTVTNRPHDYYSFILSKKINGTYDNDFYILNQVSNLTPSSGAVTRYLFDGVGHTKYETASRVLKEGTYRVEFQIKTGGANGILVESVQYEFTLTANTDVQLSGLTYRYSAVGESTFPPYPEIPVSGGRFAILSEGAKTWNIAWEWTNAGPYDWVGKKLEIWENGQWVNMNIATLLGFPDFVNINTITKSWFLLTPRSNANTILWKGRDILHTENRFRATFTLRNGGANGTVVEQKQADFTIYIQGNTTLPPYSKTPKLLFDLVNDNGNYRDATPDDYIENGVRYRNWNNRKYKAMYWINEVPWANGDVPKELGTINLRNGLIVSIRKVYADSKASWDGSKTFTDFVRLGWDFWTHGGENPNADGDLVYRTIVIHFTTNGGQNLSQGNMLREQNPSWLVADKMVPQYYFNASPYPQSDKPVCLQCVPFEPGNAQLTADRLAYGGVTHIFWQNIHGAGLYKAPMGIPTPGVNLHGLKPCFNLASQQFRDTLGPSFVFGMQATREQARQVADNTPLIDGGVYTDEFTEGSFPQFEQSREWFYERFEERALAAGITFIQGGDYGYGSQNVGLRANPGRYEPMGTYMQSLTTSNVVANLATTGASPHLKFKQYALYYSGHRDTVLGRYYAITEHPLSERMSVKALEALITINAVPNRAKVSFCAPFMQSNANGTDVPYKDSGTVKPDGSINYNYPDTPGEVMRFDAFMDKLLLDAIYVWDMYGVKDSNDINSWYGSNFGTDCFMVGSRQYDKCIAQLNEAGRQLIASDFTANGVAFNSTTTERRVPRKGNPYFNNIYFNEVTDKKIGTAIVIPSTKKVIIYHNFFLSPTQVEDVTVRYNGQSYHIGEVAGSSYALCFEP